MLVLGGERSYNILAVLQRVLFLVTAVSIILEMVFFPSIENFAGCIMMVIAHVTFVCVALKKNRILLSPFLFVVMLSMFAYRYIPVPGTLISGRPVSYGMETPIRTFALETLFFLAFTIVYLISTYGITKRRGPVSAYKAIGLYSLCSEKSIWLLGIVGLFARVVSYYKSGMYNSGLTNAVVDLMYAPSVLFFPYLIGGGDERPANFKKPLVWIYLAIITFVNLGSNSRFDILAPFIMIAIFYFIYLVKDDIDLRNILTPKKIVVGLAAILILMVVMQTLSDAILAVRNNKADYSISELIVLTAKNALDTSETDDAVVREKDGATPYSWGWTEEYIDNFALNRYGNIRVSDEIFFYSDVLSDKERADLRDDFGKRLWWVVPSPIMKLLGVGIDKKDYNYSSADYLYFKSGYGNYDRLYNSRVITSTLPDGMSLFGWYCFIIVPILLLILLWLIRGLSYYDPSGSFVYSLYGILAINTFHYIGVNGNGVINLCILLLRGLWESMLAFLVVNFIARAVGRLSLNSKVTT